MSCFNKNTHLHANPFANNNEIYINPLRRVLPKIPHCFFGNDYHTWFARSSKFFNNKFCKAAFGCLTRINE